jgi:hypothetical protein
MRVRLAGHILVRHQQSERRPLAPAPLGGEERGRIGDRCGHEGAGGEREQGARRRQAGEVRREGGDQVGEREGADREHQQSLAFDAGGGDGDQWRAEGVDERENGHQRARRRRRDAEVGGDQRQHAGDQEGLGADREGAENQGKEAEHGRRSPFSSRIVEMVCGAAGIKEFNNC